MSDCDLCKMDRKGNFMVALKTRYEYITEKTEKILLFDDILAAYHSDIDHFSIYHHFLLHEKRWNFSFDTVK